MKKQLYGLLIIFCNISASTPTSKDLDAYYNYILSRDARVYIFVEYPHRVFKMSQCAGAQVPHDDPSEMHLRMAEATIFKLFTHDLSCHTGLVIKDNGKLYQVHADIYISKRNMERKKTLLAGYDLFEPHLTVEQQEKLIQTLHLYVKENNYADIKGVLSVWVNRKRSKKERNIEYARNYYANKKEVPLDGGGVGKKFICSELVAVAFGALGIDLTPKYKFNKLYPQDVVQGGTIPFTKLTFDDWFAGK